MFTASANRLTRTLVSSLVIWMIPFLSPYAVRSAYRAWHSASLASYQAKSASDTRMGHASRPSCRISPTAASSPRSSTTLPPPRRWMVIPVHPCAVGARCMEFTLQLLEGRRGTHRLPEHRVNNGDARRGELFEQAHIARDPDLNESASRDFVFVDRHGTPPSLAEDHPGLLSARRSPRRKGYWSRCARELCPRG